MVAFLLSVCSTDVCPAGIKSPAKPTGAVTECMCIEDLPSWHTGACKHASKVPPAVTSCMHADKRLGAN